MKGLVGETDQVQVWRLADARTILDAGRPVERLFAVFTARLKQTPEDGFLAIDLREEAKTPLCMVLGHVLRLFYGERRGSLVRRKRLVLAYPSQECWEELVAWLEYLREALLCVRERIWN